MTTQGVNGLAVATAAGGVLLVWSGFKGAKVTTSLRSLLSGQQPAGVNAEPITGPVTTTAAGAGAGEGSAGAVTGDTSAHGASAAANQAIGRVLAAPYGWSAGNEWADLVSLWNRESGWNNLAQNPTSGAFGIAQALGHGEAGTAGTHGNQYPSTAANDGSAAAQISWGLSYIKSRYGDPVAAWAHETSAGSY